ncbi:MAG: hydroxymethylpyrimidine/phosphomethylpyrimidine kinase [Polyangiaceae bacterium]|nr:hydroxymethylpyrimidine/phosphomethylpyrimidine kinase [Polyangiaceae bacterium]
MRSLACALAIGGLDPGGGAGIVADLRAFAAARAFGCAVVAVSTVQSTAGLVRARAVPAREVVAQAEEVIIHQRVRAIKIGALGDRANVSAVGRLLSRHPEIPAVVDTPMLATRGRRRLLAVDAISALRRDLLPYATLATLNLAEVEAVLGVAVRTVDDARDAARALMRFGARAVLVKGGHMAGTLAVDVLAVDRALIELRARRLSLPPMHGTGCTLASLVAGRLAYGSHSTPAQARRRGRPGVDAIVAAVRWAKRAHHRALTRVANIGEGSQVIAF